MKANNANISKQSHIKGFAHIGIPVESVATSIDFYEKLGFEITEQHELHGDHGNTLVAFLSAGNAVVELYQQPQAIPAKKAGSVDHFAVLITDQDLMLERLKMLNIQLLVPPTTLPFGEKGVVYFMIEGPDKEKIEFDYYL